MLGNYGNPITSPPRSRYILDGRLTSNTTYLNFLLLSDPSDLNQIRSMRSFAFITSNTKSHRMSRSSYAKATQSSRCCGVASLMLYSQLSNFNKSKKKN
ncbi:hypothetical protein AVEN_254360-1 [Araneus ventricosus]|uniref:Uncharacterized protein n=1 Tax=Araneus ventricosus TaxID=182803 RepID=A0A4Y2KFI1_ARAVE|nr:hypothetical protein AVEN_254360-1 [Araneus ventricosus]